MTYLTKVAADTKGYLTVFQMPCSVTKKLVAYAKKNNDVMMSLGLKGVQITGKTFNTLNFQQKLKLRQTHK